MAYSRFSEGDVYLTRCDEKKWSCVSCKLHNEESISLYSIEAVAEHFREHLAAGHMIPDHAIIRVAFECGEATRARYFNGSGPAERGGYS